VLKYKYNKARGFLCKKIGWISNLDKEQGLDCKRYGWSRFEIGSRTRSQFMQSLGGLSARISGIFWIYELFSKRKIHGPNTRVVDHQSGRSTVDHGHGRAALSLKLTLPGGSDLGGLLRQHQKRQGALVVLTMASKGGVAAWFGRAMTMNIGGI
jgi:hypothetical protein